MFNANKDFIYIQCLSNIKQNSFKLIKKKECQYIYLCPSDENGVYPLIQKSCTRLCPVNDRQK